MLLNGMLTYWMAYKVLKGGGGGFFIWVGIIMLLFFSIPVVFMLGYTVSQNTAILYYSYNCCSFFPQYMLMILNMTTNERANYKRYRHFRDGHGNYSNPFSRGVFYNILEYFNIIDPVYLQNRAKSYIV